MKKFYSIIISIGFFLYFIFILYQGYRYILSNMDHSIGSISLFYIIISLPFIINLLTVFFILFKVKYKNKLYYIFNLFMIGIILILLFALLDALLGPSIPDWAFDIRDWIRKR